MAELGKDKSVTAYVWLLMRNACRVTQLSANAHPTVPISVRPKTKEPEEFTDNRIYVSNIPFSFREIDLANMFAP